MAPHATSIESAKSLLADLFSKRSVVLLGESHMIKENLDFVADLIPWLHSIGVTRLAVEFGAEEYQDRVDALIDSTDYDEAEARSILFGYNAGWPYVEYYGLYRAAHDFNRTLAPDAEKFRVINASYVFDWTKWNGQRSAATMNAIFSRGYINDFRADRIIEQVDAGHKVLGLFGAFHVLRGDHLPFEIDWLDKARPALGQILSDRLHRNIASVGLHPDLDSDSEGFGSLWQLEGSWDGYISLAAHNDLHPCTIDERFLDGHDFSEVLAAWPDPDWTPTPADFDDYWRIIRNRGM